MKRYPLDEKTRVIFDMRIDGRITSDRQNTAFQGFSEGDLSAKVMRLVGSERIYPVGLRFSGGYEADESLDVRYAVGKAQFATALPIVDDILLGWHKLFNVDVPFAPPIAAIGFVRSRAQDSTREDLNRWEAEIKWTAPVTTHLDLKIAYRLFDIRGDGKGCQRLFEAGFIYYVDESRTGGVTMAFEEGARAVIGEIGSVILAGFEIKTP